MRSSIFICFFLLLGTLSFAQKRVIIEKFTSSFCGSCPNGALIIKDLQEEYPGLIWVSHHKPTTWTTYDLDNDQSDVVYNTFNNVGTPVAMVDRTATGSNVVSTGGSWESRIVQSIDEPAYAEIDIQEGFYNPLNRELQLTVATTFEELPAEDGPFHLTVMIVQDSIVGQGDGYDQSNYFNNTAGHPLEGMGQPIVGYVHNNIARAILDGPWGSADVIPDQPEIGQAYSKTYTYTLPDFVDFDHTRAVVIVARHDENDIKQRQVINANERAFVDFVVTNTEEPTFEKLGFRLSPNPAQDFINLQFNQLPTQGRLINTQGQIIETIPTKDLSFNYNIQHLPKGSYIAQFLVDGQWINQKFIKQ